MTPSTNIPTPRTDAHVKRPNNRFESEVEMEFAQMLERENVVLRQALQGMVDRYTGLVNCGDCGNWNPEKESQVIAAREALTPPTTI